MSCRRFGNGIICLPNIYKYKGFIFENHYWCGPMKLRKDFEPAAKTGRKFLRIVTEWSKLTKKQQEKTRIYG